MEEIRDVSLVPRDSGMSRLKARCATTAERLVLEGISPHTVSPSCVSIPPGGRVNVLVKVGGPRGKQSIRLVLPTVSRPASQWRP